MTRNEAERKIAEHLETINRIAQEYGCRGIVSMAARAEDGYCSAFNPHWEDDSGNPICFNVIDGELRSETIKREVEPDAQG